MKNRRFQICLVALSLGLILTLNSCNKSNSVAPQITEPSSPIQVDEVKANAEFDEIVVRNDARLAASGNIATRGILKTAFVPDDFPTIQAAVDAVGAKGNVHVKGGTYTEVVVINKPDMNILAIGEVTLKGGFVLTAGADNTKIQKFDIKVNPGGTGINARDVTRGQIYENTITGSSGNGIRYSNSTDVSIKNNTIIGLSWGISLLESGVACNKNTFSGNTITSISFGSPIHLQGNCDNNLISENDITLKTTNVNGGIMIYGFGSTRQPDYNNINNNICNQNAQIGIWLFGGSHNAIGPYNTCNDNTFHGIYLNNSASDNNIFDNTATGNPQCDIKNEGAASNVSSNNTAGCIQGF